MMKFGNWQRRPAYMIRACFHETSGHFYLTDCRLTVDWADRSSPSWYFCTHSNVNSARTI